MMRVADVLRKACALAALATSAGIACGQWSSDPLVNLAIADQTGEQLDPKIHATSDGGCHVSWFDDSAGGYDVYLQRLDPDGNELWAHNGILIADRSFDYAQHYGLDVGADDNALLAVYGTACP